MGMTIWKYPLSITDEQVIITPDGAKLLSVQAQQGSPCIWAMVDPDARKTRRRINIFGTGHPIDKDPGEFVGTFQVSGGSLVFHVFDGGQI